MLEKILLLHIAIGIVMMVASVLWIAWQLWGVFMGRARRKRLDRDQQEELVCLRIAIYNIAEGYKGATHSGWSVVEIVDRAMEDAEQQYKDGLQPKRQKGGE